MSITPMENAGYEAAVSMVSSAIAALTSIANTSTSFTPISAPIPTAPSATSFDAIDTFLSSNTGTPTLGTYTNTSAMPAKGTLTVPSSTEMDTLSSTGFPVANLVDVLTLSTNITTAINALDALTLDFSTVPSAVSTTGLTTSIWSESFWTNVKSELGTYVTSILGASDIDAALTILTNDSTKMQNAMYAADLQRKQQVLRDLYSASAANTGSLGFLYPNMMTVAMQLDAQQKYQFDLSQVSRDLIKTITEWAKVNYQFSVDKSISAHQLDTDFNIRYTDTLVRVYEATTSVIFQEAKLKLEYAISKIENDVKVYLTHAETFLKALAGKADVYSRESDTAIKAFNANADTDIRRFAATGEVNSKDALTLSEIRQKFYNTLSEVSKTRMGIFDAKDRVAMAGYGSAVQFSVGNGSNVVRMAAESATAKCHAASAACSGAGQLAQAVSSSIVQLASS